MFKFARRQQLEGSIHLAKRRAWYAPDGEGEGDNNPPKPDPKDAAKPEYKYTQADIDAAAGNARKGAESNGFKKLLKELGFDPDDAEAVKTIKGNLAAFKQAEDDKKSVEQKALEKIAALEKERDDEKAAREQLELKSRLKERDNHIIKALGKEKASNPDDLLILMNAKRPELVSAVMKDDGTFDDGAMVKLVTAVKADYKASFIGTGPGSPSNLGGRTSNQNQVVLTHKGKF